MLSDGTETTDPEGRRFVAIAGLRQETGVGGLQHFVVDVLGAPEEHFDGERVGRPHRLLESAEQVEIVGFLPEVVRDRLDSLLQGELEAYRIDRDADAAALFQEPVDDGRVEALSRYGTAQLRVSATLAEAYRGSGRGMPMPERKRIMVAFCW